MQRRTLLQWLAALPALVSFDSIRLLAQPRELTPAAIAELRAIAPTVLPSNLGAARAAAIADNFVAWTRGYREGVALAHGYGHPRLQKSGPSPVLPARPSGQHVIVDLMAFYFRSSEANDECYNALINREVCRPIAITTRKPEALRR